MVGWLDALISIEACSILIFGWWASIIIARFWTWSAGHRDLGWFCAINTWNILELYLHKKMFFPDLNMAHEDGFHVNPNWSNRWQTQLFVGAMIYGCNRKHAWTNSKYCPVIPHTHGTSPDYTQCSYQSLDLYETPIVIFDYRKVSAKRWTQRKHAHHQNSGRNRASHDICNNESYCRYQGMKKTWPM